MSFPGWGRAFQTAIVSIVLVNQLVGPLLFKIALRRTGESGKAQGDGEIDLDAAIPTALLCGSTPEAVTMAVKLLQDRWKVVLVTGTEVEAKRVREGLGEYLRTEKARKAATARGRVTRVLASVTATVKEGGAKVGKVAMTVADGAAGAISTLADKAATAASSAAGAVGAAAPRTPAAPGATPGAGGEGGHADEEHAEEGHHDEDTFKAVEQFEVVALSGEWHSATHIPGPNPFMHDEAVTLAGTQAGGAGGNPGTGATESSAAPPDPRYAVLVATLQRLRTLQVRMGGAGWGEGGRGFSWLVTPRARSRPPQSHRRWAACCRRIS
jgi:hypothetical protein